MNYCRIEEKSSAEDGVNLKRLDLVTRKRVVVHTLQQRKKTRINLLGKALVE